jgi:predicted DNA-binding transcriptional regulator AlpA
VSRTPNAPTDEEFWRLPAVIERVGLSKSEIYRRMRDGSFPANKRYRRGSGVFWLASEVRGWQRDEAERPD